MEKQQDYIVSVPPPEGYYGLDYPVGGNMPAVKHYAKALAPHVDKLVRKLLMDGKYPRLVCRGSSGAILSAALQMVMEESVSIMHVKKPGESSHDDSAYADTDWALIAVDDFISSGATMKAIAAKLERTEFDGLVLAQPITRQLNAKLDIIRHRVRFRNIINLEHA